MATDDELKSKLNSLKIQWLIFLATLKKSVTDLCHVCVIVTTVMNYILSICQLCDAYIIDDLFLVILHHSTDAFHIKL